MSVAAYTSYFAGHSGPVTPSVASVGLPTSVYAGTDGPFVTWIRVTGTGGLYVSVNGLAASPTSFDFYLAASANPYLGYPILGDPAQIQIYPTGSPQWQAGFEKGLIGVAPSYRPHSKSAVSAPATSAPLPTSAITSVAGVKRAIIQAYSQPIYLSLDGGAVTDTNYDVKIAPTGSLAPMDALRLSVDPAQIRICSPLGGTYRLCYEVYPPELAGNWYENPLYTTLSGFRK